MLRGQALHPAEARAIRAAGIGGALLALDPGASYDNAVTTGQRLRQAGLEARRAAGMWPHGGPTVVPFTKGAGQ